MIFYTLNGHTCLVNMVDTSTELGIAAVIAKEIVQLAGPNLIIILKVVYSLSWLPGFYHLTGILKPRSRLFYTVLRRKTRMMLHCR